MKVFQVILFFLIAEILFSCKAPEVYPDEPEITFKEIIVKDTSDLLNDIKMVKIIFSLIDGNGDIGLDESDTIAPYNQGSIYYYNLYVSFFEKHDGIFEEITDLQVPYYYRIPNVSKEGQNKTLKADIQVDIDYLYPIKYDTVYYEIYIYDRALNQSNTITTNTIILNN
ncbi:MAG TPA: hypothetical protein DDX39_03780 [Bacteroidales bacterium]|nr:MAG: hypothetical protein A2W98_12540 [Bacteroidetes bacterium GWF2_33_38]OFY74028.1 MAG: hypothetical protein A2265_02770 [Bacteroidetes bacterium RIFOXYA12_FULL_33_9]OFY88755.1 MAG: hypothetical protein A2236_03730 [Bacteroidetes bacterium RIFOXYA2_FULL_33_7]HBF87741.1 hypothetical protein [Bacteroidales bacterium]